MSIEAMKQALEALENHNGNYKLSKAECAEVNKVCDNLRQAIATEESSATQEPVSWNGKPLTWKLVPVVPTQAMLDEMNLTGREGYDEVMGDGFSASLYGAALIAAPAQPKAEQEPKREPLTDEQIETLWHEDTSCDMPDELKQFKHTARAIEAAHGITASEAEDSAKG